MKGLLQYFSQGLYNQKMFAIVNVFSMSYLIVIYNDTITVYNLHSTYIARLAKTFDYANFVFSCSLLATHRPALT